MTNNPEIHFLLISQSGMDFPAFLSNKDKLLQKRSRCRIVDPFEAVTEFVFAMLETLRDDAVAMDKRLAAIQVQ